MATYTLTVVIDQRVLAMGSSDNLCLARKGMLPCNDIEMH